MTGFTGFANGVMTASNVDFRQVKPTGGQVTANGQLLIGSAVFPNIRVGTLSSAGGTVTITNGAGTINLEAGGSVPLTFTAENATTCAPVLNNLNIVGTATNGINTTAAGSTLTIAMSSPYAGNFTFENNTAATTLGLTVDNNDNDPGSTAVVHVSATPGGGDAYTLYEISGGTRYFAMGIDNSDSDYFKFTHNTDPSSANTIFMVNPAASTFTNYYANLLQTQALVAGGVNTIIQNTNNTNIASDAFLRLDVGGASAGDPFIAYLVTGAGKYAMGIDNTVAGDPFKITSGNSPSDGTDLFTMTSAGVITLANDLDVTEGGTGVSTLTSHGILLGNGAGDINATAEPSNGQLLIGKTGDFPQLAGLTPGAGISIGSGAGTITVSAWGGGLSWTTKGASTPLVNNNAFICNAGAALSFSLPAVSGVGDIVALTLDGSTSWAITQAAGQQIRFGNVETTAGAGGSLTSTAQGDTVYLLCVTANTRWTAVHRDGDITVV